MRAVYLAGRNNPEDGLFSCPDPNAIFFDDSEAKNVYKNGMCRVVYIYDTLEEYQTHLLQEEKYKARELLVKSGYTESMAQQLIP